MRANAMAGTYGAFKTTWAAKRIHSSHLHLYSNTMAYQLRERTPRNYKDLADVYLPRVTKRPKKKKDDDELYPIEVVEEAENGERVKIHYVGWSDKYDEWRSRADIVLPPSSYDPNRELAYRIKQSLNSGARHEPQVRIELTLDQHVYATGLKNSGTYVCSRRGHNIYAIQQYKDLSPLLGDKWYMRGINDRLDFCYVNLSTVRYWLHQRKAVEDFHPGGKKLIDGDNVLVFMFVRIDGVRSMYDDIAKLN